MRRRSCYGKTIDTIRRRFASVLSVWLWITRRLRLAIASNQFDSGEESAVRVRRYSAGSEVAPTRTVFLSAELELRAQI